MTAGNAQPFAELDPDRICSAIESIGLIPDGRLLALNSYENRVWQVGIEGSEPVIVKFYRPGRWTDASIEEEHRFTQELASAGVSVVAPRDIDGRTLFHDEAFRFALFDRRGGHAPELAHKPTLSALGRALGRIHAVGRADRFVHRPELTIDRWGVRARDELIAGSWIPLQLAEAFESLTQHLLDAIRITWDRAGDYRRIRLHGDCHVGNILWRDDQAHFVDLDDCVTGPAIQDLWMLIAGERHEREQQLSWLLQGYRLFAEFDPRELHLIEPLRCLRMLHHQAWLARRWDDPAFPRAFPWFEDARHWENILQQLREQLDELQQAPLAVD